MPDEELRIDLTLAVDEAVQSVNQLDRRLDQFIKNGGSGLNTLDSRLSTLKKQTQDLGTAFSKAFSSNKMLDANRLNQFAQGSGKFGQAWKPIVSDAERLDGIIQRINAHMTEGLAAHLKTRDARKAELAIAEELYQVQRQIDRDRELERYTGAAPGTLNRDPFARADLMRRRDELDSLANTRYALYDAAKTYLALAAAIGVPGIAIVKFNADYSKALTSVRRVTNESVEDFQKLGEGLIDLTTKMPIVIGDISRMATIGGQLGVATENLQNFTSVVAMFSSTTDVSAEAAATGLGRLAQLTQTSGAAYENLGSAIYQVGVTSVATEQEILNISSQIATAADLAGFANHEIIGLAGALASLGVQPEAARGSLMRIFNVITEGATGGGAALEKLAAISGLSADTIRQQWGNNSQAVFSAFVDGLNRAQQSGENTNAMLKDLGIYAVRDIRTLQVLANNTGLYADLLDQANVAYASGNSLREGFATQISNIADQFQILTQTVSAIGAEAGEGLAGPLTVIVKLLQTLADALLAVTRTDAGKFFVATAAGIAVAVSALLTWQGVMFLLRASVAALTTSQVGLRVANGEVGGSFLSLIKQLYTLGRGLASTATQTEVATAGMNHLAAASNSAAVGVGKVGAAGKAGAAATSLISRVGGGLLSFGKFIGPVAAVTVGLELLGVVISEVSERMKSAEERSREFFGEYDSLLNAVKQDTETYRKTGESIRLMTTDVETNTKVLSEGAAALDNATGSQINHETAVKNTTTAIESQTLAIGDQAKAVIANNLAANESFMTAYTTYRKELEAAGFDMAEFMSRLIQGTGTEYLDQIIAKVNELSVLDVQNDPTNTNANSLNITRELVTVLGDVRTATVGLNDDFVKMANSQQILADAGVNLNQTLEDQEDSVGSARVAFDGLKGEIENLLAVSDAFNGVADSMQENGKSFDEYSREGQANLAALQDAISGLADAAGADGAAFAANLGGMVANFQDSGVAITGNLDYMLDLMNVVFGNAWGLDFSSAAARADIQAFIADAIRALEARAALERASLSDPGLGYAGLVSKSQNLAKIEAQINALKKFQVGVTEAQRKAEEAETQARNKATAAAKKNSAANRQAVKEIRTLTDYMNDLSGVVDKAFDFRFGLDRALRKLREIREELKSNTVLFEAYSDIFEGRLFKATGVQSQADSILDAIYTMEDGFQKAADDVEDAVQRIRDTIASLAENSANQQIARYRLSVAELYGDDLRAAELRAEIQKLESDRIKTQKDLAEAQDELSDAQENTSRSLTGTSKAAIQNRKNVSDLLSEYLDYIETLEKSGASQKEVNAAITQARKDFLASATALGFSTAELQKYANVLRPVTSSQLAQAGAAADAQESMEDLTKAWQDYILELVESGASQEEVNAAIKAAKREIEAYGAKLGLSREETKKYTGAIDDLQKALNKIPNKIDINPNLSPMDRALAEWGAKGSKRKQLSSPVTIPVKIGDAPNTSAAKLKARAEAEAAMAKYAKLINGTSNMAALTEYSKQWAKAHERWKRTFARGGYTGPGPRNEPAGIVHRGEYVIPKKYVDQSTGLPYMDAFMRIARGYQGGGYVTPMPSTARNSSRTQIVELSPTDRALLAAAGDVTITLDGRVIARSTNQYNKQSSIRGTT